MLLLANIDAHIPQNCSLQNKIVIEGEYYIVGLFSIWSRYGENAFNKKAYFSHLVLVEQFKTFNLMKYNIGMISYDVCNSTELAEKAILYTLLDKAYLDKTGKSNVFFYVTYVPDDITLNVGNLIPERNLLAHTKSLFFDPDIYPNIMTIRDIMNKDIVDIIDTFQLDDIAIVGIFENRTSYNYLKHMEIWSELKKKYPYKCMTRYTMFMHNISYIKHVFQELSKSDQKEFVIGHLDDFQLNQKIFTLFANPKLHMRKNMVCE